MDNINTDNQQTALFVNNVTKSYGPSKVLQGLSLDVNCGEQVVIKGPSGCGKSTLLYLLGGLDGPDSGDISIHGQSLNSLGDEQLAKLRNDHIGMVFQFHFLLASMNAMDNVLLPAKIKGTSLASVKEYILELAAALDVVHCLKKYPHELSGGEQQRIGIIRALSLQPSLLLCDEPTGNLDRDNTHSVLALLASICNQTKTTLILVTHDEAATEYFTQVETFHQGRLH